MTFTWPIALLGLAVVPLVVAIYVWMLRRKRKYAVSYASLSLIRAALPKRSRWRRHVPFALLVAALASLALATARPQTAQTVPLSRTSIMLALDVSSSMCATDVAPNRLAAAQDAARAFVEDQPSGTRIGIVAFAGFAEIVVPPTNDKVALTTAIDGFTTSRGTAIGSATLKSIDAIAEINPDVVPAGAELTTEEIGSVGDGEYVADIVVLLTDGAVSAGADPLAAADAAAARRIRVYTIGFGTDDPQSLVCTSDQLGAGAIDSPFAGAGVTEIPEQFRQFIVIDEPTLQSMADATGGEYFRAQDSEQLLDVFLNLPAQLELQTVDEEITVVFAGLGVLLSLLAIGLSVAWNRFP